jgi:hypothetical protein
MLFAIPKYLTRIVRGPAGLVTQAIAWARLPPVYPCH